MTSRQRRMPIEQGSMSTEPELRIISSVKKRLFSMIIRERDLKLNFSKIRFEIPSK
jgi:hypothetical protein